jgi:hypothetical protein
MRLVTNKCMELVLAVVIRASCLGQLFTIVFHFVPYAWA